MRTGMMAKFSWEQHSRVECRCWQFVTTNPGPNQRTVRVEGGQD